MINIYKFRNGLNIIPRTDGNTAPVAKGDLSVYTVDGKIYYYDGTLLSPLVTEAGTATLTNKTIDTGSNSIANIRDANIAADAAIAFSKLASLPSADILIGNASNIATPFAVSGDISLSNTGVTSYVTTVPINKGGTGQVTKTAAFDALSPMTTGGDLIYGGASGTGLRLGNGSNGQVLTSSGGTSAPTWMTPSPGFQNPMTTIGDMIIGSTGGSAIRLAATTNGFILSLVGGSPAWVANTGGSAVQSIGTIDSQTKSANGLVIAGTSLFAQTADSSFPGMVSTGTQTLAGAKTFSTSISSPSVTGSTSVNTPQVNISSLAKFAQISTPSTPAAGFNDIYVKSDNNAYILDSNGNESILTSTVPIAIWSGYHKSTAQQNSWLTASPTYTDLTNNDANISLIQSNNQNFGVVTGYGASSGASALPGLVFTPTSTGLYYIKASFNANSTNTNNMDFRLWDGTNIIATASSLILASASEIFNPIELSGIYNVTSLTPTTISIQAASSASINGYLITTSLSDFRSINWSIVQLSSNTTTIAGVTGTNWKNDLTFSLSPGFGSVSGNSSIFYRRVGDSMQVRGYLTQSSTVDSVAYIQLPAGHDIDFTKIPSTGNTQVLGWTRRMGSTTVGGEFHWFSDASTPNQLFLGAANSGGVFVKSNVSAVFNPSLTEEIPFEFEIPISTWTVNNGSSQSLLVNPMTNTGDLIVGGASGAANRLGIGSTGDILTVAGGTATWAPAGAGSSDLDYFASSQVTTNSTTTSSSTFSTASNSPTFVVTPNFTGKYKIYGSIPIEVSSGPGNAVCRIFNTVGSATLLNEQEGGQFNPTAGNLVTSVLTQSVYTLTASTSYTFVLQHRNVSGSNTSTIAGNSATGNNFYLFAERIG